MHAIRLLFSLLIVAILVQSTEGFAGTNEVQAEQIRLQTELEKLIKRNAWKGVERTYVDLLALGVPLRPVDHLAGEQSARNQGDINLAYDRLQAAIAGDDPNAQTDDPVLDDIRARIQTIESRYGTVDITVHEGRVAALVRFEWPFAREERVCIENGRTKLAETRSYSGFLPIGKYMVDGHFFEVSPKSETLSLTIAPLSE